MSNEQQIFPFLILALASSKVRHRRNQETNAEFEYVTEDVSTGLSPYLKGTASKECHGGLSNRSIGEM